MRLDECKAVNRPEPRDGDWQVIRWLLKCEVVTSHRFLRLRHLYRIHYEFSLRFRILDELKRPLLPVHLLQDLGPLLRNGQDLELVIMQEIWMHGVKIRPLLEQFTFYFLQLFNALSFSRHQLAHYIVEQFKFGHLE